MSVGRRTPRTGAKARRPPFVLPKIARAIGERLPSLPASFAASLVLSAVAPRLFERAALCGLEGKSFRFIARDAGVSVALRVRAERFEPRPAAAPADVTISACVADFALLATRRADPDTLFFERRLLVEGDTETGLWLKNMLDGIELPRWLTGA
ncbi:MAG TPA: SCP2 sterol-binding domain-containing protein [Casimicrobiaceae bacterium]